MSSDLEFSPVFLRVLSRKGRRWYNGVLPLGRERNEMIACSVEFVDGLGWRLPEEVAIELSRYAVAQTSGRHVAIVYLVGYVKTEEEQQEKVVVPVL